MKEYKIKINGNEYTVAINGIEGTTADVTVNGTLYAVEVPEGLLASAGAGLNASGVGSADPTVSRSPRFRAAGGTSFGTNPASGSKQPAGATVVASPATANSVSGGKQPSGAGASAGAPAGASAGGKVIKSPLPGVIIGLEAREGQAVKKGQRVAVLEAMKMENDILAECDGTIAAVHVGKGDSVLEGAALVTIA